MSEEIKPNTFPAIPKDALVDIQVSGTFYRQLTKLALALGESRPPEDFKKALESLNDPNKYPSDLFELTVASVVAMVFEIETKAKEQGKIEMVEMNLETGEVIPPSGS